MVELPETSLERKTKSLGYPLYSSIKKADALAKKFHKAIPKNLKESDKDLLFLLPGIYFKEFARKKPQTDPYIFKSSVILNNLLLNTKELLRSNNLPFNEKSFLSDNLLCKNFPPSIMILEKRNSGIQAELGELALESPVPIIEAIENEFYFFFQYNSEKSTPGIEKLLQARTKKVSKLANIADKFPKILKGVGLRNEAASLKESLTNLKDSSLLYQALQSDQIAEEMSPLLKAHAELKKVKYSGNIWNFSDSMGHEITAAMDLAKSLEFYQHMLSNQELSDQENLAFSLDKNLYFIENALVETEQKKSFQENQTDYLAQCILMQNEESTIIKELLFTKAPFSGLENMLTSFGIPSKKATAIKKYLSANSLNRSFAFDKDGFATRKEMIKEIYNEGERFTPAASQLVESVTGQKPSPFSYKFFTDETSSADAVRTITYAARLESGEQNEH
ncbi:hypothetical protein HN903_04625 [archaeon]|nr:hypothetical protein [archaeon]MBT7129013.1 hypothetical protein [archaeon]